MLPSGSQIWSLNSLKGIVEDGFLKRIWLSQIDITPQRGWIGSKEQENESRSLEKDFPSLELVQKDHIKRALKLTKGKIEGKTGAASLLIVKPSTLRDKMKKLGISRS